MSVPQIQSLGFLLFGQTGVEIAARRSRIIQFLGFTIVRLEPEKTGWLSMSLQERLKDPWKRNQGSPEGFYQSHCNWGCCRKMGSISACCLNLNLFCFVKVCPNALLNFSPLYTATWESFGVEVLVENKLIYILFDDRFFLKLWLKPSLISFDKKDICPGPFAGIGFILPERPGSGVIQEAF